MRPRYLVLAAAAFAACGYPEFHYTDEVSTTVASGKSSSASGASTASSGATGSGGAAACVLGTSGGACKTTQKCSWDAKLGGPACVAAGPFVQWQRCTSDTDCGVGLWCDLQMKTCKKVCAGAADCSGGGSCIPALDATGKQLAPNTDDFKHCTSNCNPKAPKPPCNGDQTTCVLRKTNPGFDCAAVTAMKAPGDTCTVSSDCVPGSVCVNEGFGLTCTQWCKDFPPKNDCPDVGFRCCKFSAHPSRGSTEFGFCGFLC
jgi:hypothetical protein